MKKLKLGLVLGLAMVLVSTFALPDPAAAAEKKMWRWGTSNPGAYGYRVSAFLVRFLAKGDAGLRRYRLPIRFNHR